MVHFWGIYDLSNIGKFSGDTLYVQMRVYYLQLNVGSLDEFYYLSILEVSEIHINGLTSVYPILATLGDLRGVPAGILSQQELV